MNHERIGKLREVILANPEHFYMGTWVRQLNTRGEFEHTIVVKTVPDTLECGTTFCVAGWAAYLWKAETRPLEHVSTAARRILGLTVSQARELFYSEPDEALDALARWAEVEA